MSLRRVLCLAAGLLLPLCAQAQTGPAPVPVAPAGLPALDELQSVDYRAQAYPDWQGQLLRNAALVERKRSEGGVLGLLTLTPGADCWVSVLYYAATGRGLELLDAQPLPYGQLTTLSFPLPPGDDGLTRLIVWRERPAASLLKRVEDAAWQPRLLLAGLLDERWFGRTAPGAVQPYLDERQPVPPTGFFRARGPSFRATIATDGVVTARNCAVYFRGPTRFSSDSWGSFGQWQLGGPPLEVKLVVPPRRDYVRAVLRLHGQLDGPFAPSEAPRLRLEVNGWRSGEVQLTQGRNEPEQVSFDVSQNIEYGLNTLTLRSDGFGADWLLRSIELWIE